MSFLSGPGGTSIYLRQSGENIQHSSNQSSWTTISAWPILLQNSNTGAGTLTLVFTTDLSITNNNNYIYCNSTNLQIGSSSLNVDGSRPTITITDVTNFTGFITNYDGTKGFNNISIYNLIISPSGTTTLGGDGGWLTRTNFGKGALNNLIENCTSTGAIPAGGGICAGYTSGNASGVGGQLTIRNCNSTGAISATCGGIVGYNSGQGAGTQITCENCSSSGSIAGSAGGIFGSSCGITSGSCSATNCYSTGIISAAGAGGIFGTSAGSSSGSASALRCYSTGNIISGGGIYGTNSGTTSGFASATNCYSSGSISGGGSGIFATTAGNKTESQCYSANGSWSDGTAGTSLSGAPSGSPVGSVWASLAINEPYILASVGGYSPYTATTTTTTSASITAGQSTSAATVPGYTYQLLAVNDDSPTSFSYISVDSSTGALTAGTSTPGGDYVIIIYSSINPYVITTYTLSVTALPQTASEGTTEEGVGCCAIPMDIGKDVDYETRNKFESGNAIIGGTRGRGPFASYSMLLYERMAYASKR
jgi:hypothetical protein